MASKRGCSAWRVGIASRPAQKWGRERLLLRGIPRQGLEFAPVPDYPVQGIDAPERGQPFGTVARDRMTALAKGKTATIHGHGNDAGLAAAEQQGQSR